MSHIRRSDEAGLADQGRSEFIQGHRDAPAGALAVPRRHRREGRKRSVHQCGRQQGRKYDIPVLVGGLAFNRENLSHRLGCAFEEMDERWVRAIQAPIPPRIVENAPCHEVVIEGRRR